MKHEEVQTVPTLCCCSSSPSCAADARRRAARPSANDRRRDDHDARKDGAAQRPRRRWPAHRRRHVQRRRDAVGAVKSRTKEERSRTRWSPASGRQVDCSRAVTEREVVRCRIQPVGVDSAASFHSSTRTRRAATPSRISIRGTSVDHRRGTTHETERRRILDQLRQLVLGDAAALAAPVARDLARGVSDASSSRPLRWRRPQLGQIREVRGRPGAVEQVQPSRQAGLYRLRDHRPSGAMPVPPATNRNWVSDGSGRQDERAERPIHGHARTTPQPAQVRSPSPAARARAGTPDGRVRPTRLGSRGNRVGHARPAVR